MSSSVVVDVKQAIKTGLATAYAALASFNGATAPERKVEVAYGYDANSSAAERVFMGRSRADTPPAALRSGRNYRDETGFFDLTVLVAYVGGSAEDAEDRAMAIGQVAEEWIADRKSNELGVTGLQTLRIDGWDLEPMFNDRGHMAVLVYRVRWTARLT
jgi:hypothetical protein